MKNTCSNTYTNRRLAGYIECLLYADGVQNEFHASVERFYRGGGNYLEVLKSSRAMNEAVLNIMRQRSAVSGILDAVAAFDTRARADGDLGIENG